jgi:hypothetical protein
LKKSLPIANKSGSSVHFKSSNKGWSLNYFIQSHCKCLPKSKAWVCIIHIQQVVGDLLGYDILFYGGKMRFENDLWGLKLETVRHLLLCHLPPWMLV